MKMQYHMMMREMLYIHNQVIITINKVSCREEIQWIIMDLRLLKYIKRRIKIMK